MITGIWKPTLKTSLPLAALWGSLMSNSPVFQAARLFVITLLLLQWMHELPTSEQSVASEKSCAINCGWNIYLAVGKLEGICAVCFTPVRFAIFPFVIFKRVLFAHPLTVTHHHVFFSLLFCFVFLFWQLCHGPCLYSFSSSLSNISLNTIAKSGMFVFLTSIFFF